MTQSPPTGELVARHTWERRMRDKWLEPETIRLHAGECSRGEVFAAQAIAGLVITEAADAITTLERELEEARAALKPFDRLGQIILAEAPAEAKTIVMFTSSSGEMFSMKLDYFREARAALQVEESKG